MSSKIWISFLIFIIVLGGMYFIFKGKSTTPAPASQQQTVQPSPSTAPSGAMTSPEAGQTVTVVGTEFAFTPSTITVKKGQAVTVTFKNNGQYPHNFTVAELNVKSETVSPGQETTVTFTPDKAGSFTFICSVPGHADRGMKGTLVVQ